jgi:hypothetical protein
MGIVEDRYCECLAHEGEELAPCIFRNSLVGSGMNAKHWYCKYCWNKISKIKTEGRVALADTKFLGLGKNRNKD